MKREEHRSIAGDRSSPLTFDQLKEAFAHLPKDAPSSVIEQVAKELEMHTYTPPLLIDMPGLIRAGRRQIASHVSRVLTLPDEAEELALPQFGGDAQQVRLVHLRLLLDQYLLITDLRAGIPEAWDRINELYEDD